MSVTAPPRRPEATDPPASGEGEFEALVEALIEEARLRARRRRRRTAMAGAAALVAGVAVVSLVGRESLSTAVGREARPTATAPTARPAGTIALTGIVGGGFRVRLWTPGGVRDTTIRGRAFGWSPDGSRLLVQRGSALYAVRLGGAGEVLLTAHGNGFDAAWSPDGAMVAFAGGPVPGRPAYRRLLVVGADGRGVRALRGWVADGGFFSGNVTWSPDGRKVVFAGRTASDRRRWLYRVAADGTAPPEPLAVEVAVSAPVQPTWSPDGSRLAFSDSGTGSIGDLVIASAGGRVVRRIAGGTGPVWSPDGSMLAFRTHGRAGAWTARADGTHVTRLPSGSWAGLSWSPDSRHIAFAGGGGHIANGDVFVVRSDGTGLVRILRRPGGRYGLPLWRHGTATTEAG